MIEFGQRVECNACGNSWENTTGELERFVCKKCNRIWHSEGFTATNWIITIRRS